VIKVCVNRNNWAAVGVEGCCYGNVDDVADSQKKRVSGTTFVLFSVHRLVLSVAHK